MFLSRLVYFSHPSTLGHRDIDTILTVSNANNYLEHVTGALFYNGRWFVQVLEGPRRAVTAMFVKICADKRHHAVSLIEFTRIEERSFPEWSMRYLGANAEQEAIIRRFMPGEFDPTLVTDGVVMTRLLQALSAAAPPPE